MALLDLYCRNDVYAIADSSTVNETGYPLKQVIPSKARCGSLNPYTMIRKDKCYCNNEPTTENKNSTEPSKIGKHAIVSIFHILIQSKYIVNNANYYEYL